MTKVVRQFPAVACLVAAIVAASQIASAQEAPAQSMSLNIDAPKLSRALIQLSERAGLQLIYPAGNQVADLPARPLNGTFTPQAALDHLLKGSGLQYEFLDARTIAITDPSAKPASRRGEEGSIKRDGQEKTASLGDVEVAPRTAAGGRFWRVAQTSASAGAQDTRAAAASGAGESEELTDVVVSAQFYRKQDSSAATRFDMPLIDTPQSITVVNSDVIKTFGITDLKWVSKYVAGLESRMTSYGETSDFTARGFTLNMQDGYKMNGFQYINAQPIDTVAVERIEFLKGPTGILYGRNDYGGMLNYVTKQANYTNSQSIGASFSGGGIELARVEADINMVLADDKVALRLPLAYQQHDDYLLHDARQFTAVPSLRWDVSDDLKVTFGSVIQHFRAAGQGGTSPVAVGATAEDVNWATAPVLARCRNLTCITPPKYLRDVYFGPENQFNETRSVQANVKVDYRISDNLSYFISGSTQRAGMEAQQYYIGTITAEDGTAFLNSDALDFTWRSRTVETGLTGKFPAFGREHQFYLGGDFRRYKERRFDYDEFVHEPGFNVFDFRSTGQFQRWLADNDLGGARIPYSWYRDTDREDWGLGAQAVFELSDSLSLLAGLRYDNSEFTEEYTQLIGGCISTSCQRAGNYGGAFDTLGEGNVVLPRAGLTWKIVPDRWTAYVSYTEGFIPQVGVTRSGDLIDPEEGNQIEIGLKGQLFDNRLFLSLAAWQIDREGVVIADPANTPDEIFVIGGLDQRNKGVEFEAMGRITPALNLILAASKTDGKFGESDIPGAAFWAGREITSTPDYKYSGYVNYDFQAGSLFGLSLGGGVTAVGPQWGVFPAALRVPSYTTVDVKAGYSFNEKTRITLMLQNGLDENYFVSRGTTWDGCCLAFGDERSYRLSIETKL
jgi:iron complex outermembrane receptor protein